MFHKLNNFQQRLVIHFFSLALIISTVLTSHQSQFNIVFALVVCLIQAVALKEFYCIAQSKQARPLKKLGLIIGAAAVFAPLAAGINALEMFLIILLLVLLLACSLTRFHHLEQSLLDISITCLGVLYISVPSALFIKINFLPDVEIRGDGRFWIFYLIAITKMTDTFSYIIGKKYGKTLLAPQLSPKKTWEGAWGGFLAAIVTSISCYYFPILWPQAQGVLSFQDSLILGITFGIVAQLGDLVESLFKRDAGVKDSNHIPGVGGILDIIDSLLFTIPCLYIYLYVHCTF